MDMERVLERRNRVVEWTVEIMAQQLQAVIEVRRESNLRPDPHQIIEELEQSSLSQYERDRMVFDEVAEAIILPDYGSKKNRSVPGSSGSPLDPVVLFELRSYVQTIASLYNENPFHNFDHAGHVVMSVNKLWSRINGRDVDDCETEEQTHDTYGIAGDPLTWFACLFSALIHDVDHSGVPNAQLVKEGDPLAGFYDGKSVAEQNSFDIAWDLLMEPYYDNLRRTIYVTTGEFRRFRQLVVNSVMATDICDKDLKAQRNRRWDTAFDPLNEGGSYSTILKATIVIDHLIQASDIAHTMQHWHIYQKWNGRFFEECYKAYIEGRAEKDPTEGWYKGELGFYDFYIIPLAKKLKECGVFGVSSDEYLNYALQNRSEWEKRGQQVVADLSYKVNRKFNKSKRRSVLGSASTSEAETEETQEE